MEVGKMTCQISVSLGNTQEFRDLVEKFNQKARELSQIAHELECFEFRGQLETQALSTDAD